MCLRHHFTFFQSVCNPITQTNIMSTEAGCQLDAAHPINLDAQLFHLPICLSWHCTTDSAILCCLNMIHSSLYESWDLPLVLVSQVVTASMHSALASELLESSCVLCHFVFEVYFSHWVSNLTSHWGYTWLNTETSQAPVSWQHMVHAALCCVAANWHFHGIHFFFLFCILQTHHEHDLCWGGRRCTLEGVSLAIVKT